jgi:hypothetical protein
MRARTAGRILAGTYQAAVRQKAGRITAVGMTREVTFAPVNGPINQLIDKAYRAKYLSSPYLKPMIGARARVQPYRLCISMSISNPPGAVLMLDEVRMASPALEKYTQSSIGNLWKRPNLSPRNRDIVTVATLFARNQTIGMPQYFNLALDQGVTPAGLSATSKERLCLTIGGENRRPAAFIDVDINTLFRAVDQREREED